jgi:mono/diheme cytochrome c family protein
MKHVALVWAAFAVIAFCHGSYVAYAENQPSVAAGKKLFNDPSLGTNGKSCASCHRTDENIKRDAARHPEDSSLKSVINGCITENLKGNPLPEASANMESLVMYIRSVK